MFVFIVFTGFYYHFYIKTDDEYENNSMTKDPIAIDASIFDDPYSTKKDCKQKNLIYFVKIDSSIFMNPKQFPPIHHKLYWIDENSDPDDLVHISKLKPKLSKCLSVEETNQQISKIVPLPKSFKSKRRNKNRKKLLFNSTNILFKN